MPSALLLRKHQLSLLQDMIIPDIERNGACRLAVMRPPLQLPEGMTVRENPHALLKIAQGDKRPLGGMVWDDMQLHASPYFSLSCIVEGQADLQMGITDEMAREDSLHKNHFGSYIVSMTAPSYALFPPRVPRKRGQPPWEQSQLHVGITRIFHVRILPVGALCNICILEGSSYEVQYSLLINDPHLLPIIEVLLDESNNPSTDPKVTKAQLLSLMLRLQRSMTATVPQMTDGLFTRFPDDEPKLKPQSSSHPSINLIHEYIKLHLHENLSPSVLAAKVRLSPGQLNRIFRKHTGLSTMEYVLRLRMEVACVLLQTSTQPIQEIAKLVGYAHLSHFSRIFHRHHDVSPLHFRQNSTLEDLIYKNDRES